MEQVSNFVNLPNSNGYIEILRNEYIEKHIKEQERDELINENNIEKRDIRGYHGREIFELLQNADDAYQKSIDEGKKPNCDLEVFIDYRDNKLSVSNTGTYFDRNGIKAIIQGNNSPKSGKYIGNKGTGFRSVLNWADEINIHSGEFNIKFSKIIAKDIFDKMKNENQISKQLKKYPNLYIPMLAVPKNIEHKSDNKNTLIEVLINPEKLYDDFGVLKQIKNIDLRILLFMPNIEKITITTEEERITYQRSIIDDVFRTVVLEKLVDDAKVYEEKFYLFEKTLPNYIEEDNLKKDVKLAIAVPEDNEKFETGYIYSFFPLLGAESPFDCVMHASYSLGDHRDTIVSNETNKIIIKKQLEFLVEVGQHFAYSEFGDKALQLLTPNNFRGSHWKFASDFSKFDLEEYYQDMFAQSNVLQTVNDEYLKLLNNPIVLNSEFPDFFIGNEFKFLLKPIKSKYYMFIQYLCRRLNINLLPDTSELVEIINQLSEEWNVEECVKVFSWWNNSFSNQLPKLLKNQNSEWLVLNDDCYLLTGEVANIDIPKWVKVPALHIDYQELLFEDARNHKEIMRIRENDTTTHISRLISQRNIYPLIKFAYRDTSNIISTVNSSVSTYENSIDFIKWIWLNYGDSSEEWNPPKGSEKSPVKYKFPSDDGKTLLESEKLFWGSSYKNYLSERLFDGTCKAFASIDRFKVEKGYTENFKRLISKFGVKDYPSITRQYVNPIASYSNIYNKYILAKGDIGASIRVNLRFYLPFIKNLTNKLEILETHEIVDWIHKDSKLRTYLSTPNYIDNASISYIGNTQQNYRSHREPILNYILFAFNYIKWIEIDDKKYAPKEILSALNTKGNSSFSDLVPTIDTDMIKKIAQKLNIDYDISFEIFNLFKFCDEITDLASEDFYSFLLKLPDYEYSKSVELSKKIYRIIERPSFTRRYSKSQSKNDFFNQGKVLVRLNREYQYCLAKETYLPSAKIINKDIIPILEKKQRTNNENFVKVFGCQLYNKDYYIEKNTISNSICNSEFQNYFREFIKYAKAFSEKNVSYERDIQKLSVTLVDKISITENGSVMNVEDEYVCIRDSSTNWYITAMGEDFEVNKISEIIENICANIANSPGFESSKVGELFRTRSKQDREFLIKKEFGSLDLISDHYYSNEIKNNFIETVLKIDQYYNVKAIDIDFNNFSCDDNYITIINVLDEIGKDLIEFKKAGFVYTINLLPYFKNVLKEFKYREIRNFKNVLYTKALKDTTLQDAFFDMIDKFNDFSIEDYNYSIYYDVEAAIRGRFNYYANEESEKMKLIDSEKTYASNYEILNPERLFEDDISNNKSVQRMIYFNKTNKFNKWLEKKKNQERLNEEKKTTDPYAEYKDIIPKKGELVFSNQNSNKKRRTPNGSGTYSSSYSDRKNYNQKIKGNKGELIVYNLLCNEYGKENVFPKSEAFVELGLLKPGQASSGKYDIAYRDEKGSEFFVEVKTGNGKSFIITPGELKFAKSNSEKYELILVYEIDSETPQYAKLPLKFWEDKRFKETVVVERIEYEF